MRPHVIPQQFNQSDRIGKFTMPQFVILAAVTCIYVLIVISSNFWVSLISFFPLAATAFVMMYFRVNKIPIYEFLMIYAIYIGSPKLLLYRSDNLKSIEEIEEGIGFIDIDKQNKQKIKTKEMKDEDKKKKVNNSKAPQNPKGKQPPVKQPPGKQQPKKRVVQDVNKGKKGVK